MPTHDCDWCGKPARGPFWLVENTKLFEPRSADLICGECRFSNYDLSNGDSVVQKSKPLT